METAVARTDCSCAVLGRERFIESVQSNPELDNGSEKIDEITVIP